MFDFELASAFYETARLLLITGANEHRANAYYHAALVLDGYEKRVEELARSGSLEEIPGIGKGLADKTAKLLDSGSLPLLDSLREQVPTWLVNLTDIRGLGPRTIARLYGAGVKRPEDLRKYLADNSLPQRVRASLAAALESQAVADSPPRLQLAHAALIAEELATWLRDACWAIETSGELRRCEETVAAIELVAGSADFGTVTRKIQSYRLSQGSPHIQGPEIDIQTRLGIPIKVTVARSRRDFVWSGFVKTSTPSHVKALLARPTITSSAIAEALAATLRNGYDAAVLPDITEEAEIYSAVHLPWIPPELRVGNGEIDLAASGRIGALVDGSRVRGDLHLHTRWSDGINSIAEMADSARSHGYEYIAVTDHSAHLKIANGLGVERLLRQVDEIKHWNRSHDDFRILTGIEVDILPDGSLDLPTHVLSQLDWVIASVHTSMDMAELDMMARLRRALEHPCVNAIGHPTGRLLGKPGQIFYHREPYAVAFDQLLQLCKQHGKGLEINCFPERMDLSSELAYEASKCGVDLHIGTDAHSSRHLSLMRHGIEAARRAQLCSSDLVNCRTAEEVVQLRRRERVGRSKTKRTGVGAFGMVLEDRPRRFDTFFSPHKCVRSGAPCVGIDLTANEKRASGWALVQGRQVETKLLRTDEELIEKTLASRPAVVSIDSPLSLPVGRCCADDSCQCRRYGIVRAAERSLMRMRIGVFPALLPSMAKLTLRGIKIAAALRACGLEVIESYPGAAQDMMGISRKGKGLDLVVTGLRSFGMQIQGSESHDELDAVTSALVGLFWLTGQYVALGRNEENFLIVPRIPKFREGKERIVVGIAGLPAAGKTTVGEYLSFKYGLRYTRYSQVLASQFSKQHGRSPTRVELQEFGLAMRQTVGPVNLTERVLENMSDDESWVIDGIRHRDDFQTLRARVGSRFQLVFIDAPAKIRAQRSVNDGERIGSNWFSHPVDSEVLGLAENATVRLVNSGSFKALFEQVDSVMGFK